MSTWILLLLKVACTLKGIFWIGKGFVSLLIRKGETGSEHLPESDPLAVYAQDMGKRLGVKYLMVLKGDAKAKKVSSDFMSLTIPPGMRERMGDAALKPLIVLALLRIKRANVDLNWVMLIGAVALGAGIAGESRFFVGLSDPDDIQLASLMLLIAISLPLLLVFYYWRERGDQRKATGLVLSSDLHSLVTDAHSRVERESGLSYLDQWRVRNVAALLLRPGLSMEPAVSFGSRKADEARLHCEDAERQSLTSG